MCLVSLIETAAARSQTRSPDIRRYGEIWGDMGRRHQGAAPTLQGEIWGDMGRYDRERAEIGTHSPCNQALHEAGLVKTLLRALAEASPHDREVSVSLLARLVLGSRHFLRQLLCDGQCGDQGGEPCDGRCGLTAAAAAACLDPRCSAASLVNALLLLCHAAGAARSCIRAHVFERTRLPPSSTVFRRIRPHSAVLTVFASPRLHAVL